MKALKKDAFWVSKIFNQEEQDSDWVAYKPSMYQNVPCYSAFKFGVDCFYSYESFDTNTPVYSVTKDGVIKQVVTSVSQVGMNFSLENAEFVAKHTLDFDDNYPSICFGDNGKIFYVTHVYDASVSGGKVYVFHLSEAYNLKSVQSTQVINFNEEVIDIAFSTDGKYVYITSESDKGNEVIKQFQLSKPWDLSNRSLVAQLSLNNAHYIEFSNDGSKMYVAHVIPGGKDSIREYQLSEPWNISSSITAASYIQTLDYLRGFTLSSDGHHLLIVGHNSSEPNQIMEYYLPNAWSLGNAQLKNTIEANAWSVCYDSEGRKLFYSQFSGNDIVEYALSYYKISLGPESGTNLSAVLKQKPASLSVVLETKPERCTYKDVDLTPFTLKADKSSFVCIKRPSQVIDVNDKILVNDNLQVNIVNKVETETGFVAEIDSTVYDIKYISDYDEIVIACEKDNSCGFVRLSSDLSTIKRRSTFLKHNDNFVLKAIGGKITEDADGNKHIPLAGYIFVSVSEGISWFPIKVLFTYEGSVHIYNWYYIPGGEFSFIHDDNLAVVKDQSNGGCIIFDMSILSSTTSDSHPIWGMPISPLFYDALPSFSTHLGTEFIATSNGFIVYEDDDHNTRYKLPINKDTRVVLNPYNNSELFICGVTDDKNLLCFTYDIGNKLFVNKVCKIPNIKSIVSDIYPVSKNLFIVCCLDNHDRKSYILLRRNDDGILEPLRVHAYNDFTSSNVKFAKSDTTLYVLNNNVIAGVYKDKLTLPETFGSVKTYEIYVPNYSFESPSYSTESLSTKSDSYAEQNISLDTYFPTVSVKNRHISKDALQFTIDSTLDSNISKVVVPSRLQQQTIDHFSTSQSAYDQLAKITSYYKQQSKTGRYIRFAVKGDTNTEVNKVQIDLWKRNSSGG